MKRITIDDFRIYKEDRGSYRCGRCNQMKYHEDGIIYVSQSASGFEGILFGNSAESLLIGHWDSHRTGWCVPCVQWVIRRDIKNWLRGLSWWGSKEGRDG